MRNFASNGRLWIVGLGLFAGFGLVAHRLVDLHLSQRESALEELERARRRVDVLPARRGDIVDARGTLVATSRSLVEVGVDPVRYVTPDPAVLAEAARLLELAPEELENAVRTRRAPRRNADAPPVDGVRPITFATLAAVPAEPADVLPAVAEPDASAEPAPAAAAAAAAPREIRWVRLHEGIDESDYARLLELGVPGVYGNRTYRRLYPGGRMAAHVIGFVNREGQPSGGVEAVHDFYLRGQEGWRESERDGRRREMPRFRTREMPATDGLNVQLSLDLVVQHALEQEVERIVREYNPLGVTILASEPDTGFLLGLANHPTFDLNAFRTAPLDHQRNRAITDFYEPGSSFKIVAVGAALEEGIITAGDTFDCDLTSVEINGRRVGLPREAHAGMGRLNVAQIIARSSNVGTAQIGMALGARRLFAHASAFGFGERTGIPLGGEAAGMLAPPERWDGLTITRLPIGHAVGATPLQIHAAMAAVANEGVLMRPQVVRRIVAHDGATFLAYEPVPRRRALDPRTARQLALLLADVVGPQGTANAAAIPGYRIAGKTGTTQKIIDGAYSSEHHVATFTGFFPAGSPRIALTVVVDDAQVPGTAYASRIAAPAFRNIALRLIQYYGIPPEPGTGIAGR